MSKRRPTVAYPLRVLQIAAVLTSISGCSKSDLDAALSHNAHLRQALVKIESRKDLGRAIHKNIDMACAIVPSANIEEIAKRIGDVSLTTSGIWIPIGDESWTLAYRLEDKRWDFIAFLNAPGSLVFDQELFKYDTACVGAPVYLVPVQFPTATYLATKIILSN